MAAPGPTAAPGPRRGDGGVSHTRTRVFVCVCVCVCPPPAPQPSVNCLSAARPDTGPSRGRGAGGGAGRGRHRWDKAAPWRRRGWRAGSAPLCREGKLRGLAVGACPPPGTARHGPGSTACPGEGAGWRQRPKTGGRGGLPGPRPPERRAPSGHGGDEDGPCDRLPTIASRREGSFHPPRGLGHRRCSPPGPCSPPLFPRGVSRRIRPRQRVWCNWGARLMSPRKSPFVFLPACAHTRAPFVSDF